ncbi:MAG: hypothetical protein WCW35_14610 [Bacteroidota bacterium]|jgi:hypothetical protein
MILPNEVVDAIVSKILLNKSDLAITDCISISEDTKTKEIAPPYCAVFADFQSDSADITGDNVLLDVPVEIKILCSSGDNRSAAESFIEAFAIANKIMTLIRGIVTTSGGAEAEIITRRKPFEILTHKADQTIVQVNFYYELKSVGE